MGWMLHSAMATTQRMSTIPTLKEGLVISCDIGTTKSAVSYCHLYPGEAPVVRSVVKWPNQPEASGDSKIPTIVAYRNGDAKKIGAEATDFINDDEYEMATWFKLHLHPESMKPSNAGKSTSTIEAPPLPRGVTLGKIYADFLRYLFITTKSFFINNTPNGQGIWDRATRNLILVLCTPNGWDITQQTFLTTATISAGIFATRNDADKRLHFITEGEASVHYALHHTNTATWLRPSEMFLCVDAGGSTVDSTLYQCTSLEPLSLDEVCASECVQAGGVFVDRAMRNVLETKLFSSSYGDPDSLAAMVEAFEKRTKRLFDGTQATSVIQFGSSRDTDREYGIIKGKITLSGAEIEQAFSNVVESVVQSCNRLIGQRTIRNILLVGGFGESPHLRARLQVAFASRGAQVVIVDEPSRKAAADGAVIWWTKQLVRGRAARRSCGMVMGVDYDQALHRQRERHTYVNSEGLRRISVFNAMIPRNTIITDSWTASEKYHRDFRQKPQAGDLGTLKTSLFVWEGPGETKWPYDEQGKRLTQLRRLCTITADLSQLLSSIQSRIGADGRPVWRIHYGVEIGFEHSKLWARLVWEHGTVERRGPATIVPATEY